jgi:holo-[acyl-carrier protein] synthase
VIVGVGLDAVEVDRFRRVLARTPGVADRVFTAAERAYGSLAPDPAQRLAARFAAKEAAMKALGVGIGAIGWHDVEVVRADGGAPSLRVTGRAATLAAAQGVTAWRVSITHTRSSAHAIVIVT